MDHTAFVSEWLIVSQIVGYTAGTVVTILLFVLVRRAARFDDPSPYGPLLWSVLLWNAGNLLASACLLAGVPGGGTLVRVTMAVAYSAAALSPAGALILWRQTARRSVDAEAIARAAEPPSSPASARTVPRARPPRGVRGSAAGTVLVAASIVSGVVLTLLMWEQVWRGVVPEKALWTRLGYHVAAFFVAGALLFYRGHVTIVATRVAIGMTGLGALGVGLSVLLQRPLPADPQAFDTTVALAMFRLAATHVMTLGALVFLARFRFADVFVRESLRMIAALLLGVLGVFLFAFLAMLVVVTGATYPRPVALVGGALFVAALILSFTLIDRLIVAIVDRGLFRQPDYAAALRRLRDDLALQHADEALSAATARHVRETLDLREARVLPRATLAASLQDELVQRDVIDVADARPSTLTGDALLGPMVPIRTAGTVSAVLTVTPRPDHPTFLAREVEFLRAAATTLGHRLDVVHREREEIERHTHEAHLRQQLSEATLRALQAQVNPHFLFNTLNTIAHLIQADPASAEGMTLRLAEVFSHVLTRSLRPFSSVREEMEFLRTYLTIEEARFGDRLRVAFDVDPAAAQASIPSLILQPAVENALKHGLAPKIGPGHLTISAVVDGTSLRLSVEDDGVGFRAPASPIIEHGVSRSIAPGAATSSHRLLVRGGREAVSDARTLRAGSPGGNDRGGVGLRNISERLQTIYADRASLQFDSVPQGGSIVTLRLPFQQHLHDQKPVD